jgi:predicted transposase YdaD
MGRSLWFQGSLQELKMEICSGPDFDVARCDDTPVRDRTTDILELYNFLDYLFNLPEDLEQQLQIELTAFEEAKQMKYITSIERMGEARGMALGEARGEARGAQSKAIAIALNMLNDSLPLEQISRFTGLTIEEIQQLQASKQ